MVRKTLALGLTILALATAGKTAPAQSADLQKAQQEYSAGNFREAIQLYQGALESGERSAALFYNLGNAWFRDGNLGRAILNYERALTLKPDHPEAAANLHLTRDKARALELQSLWWNEFTDHLTSRQYAIIAGVSLWVAAFCFFGWLFAQRRSTPLLLVALVGLLVSLGSATALYGLEIGPHGRTFAIVVAPKVEARVATADNAPSVLVLPPGTGIKILSKRGDWIYAALPNNLRGWIPAESAERVRL